MDAVRNKSLKLLVMSIIALAIGASVLSTSSPADAAPRERAPKSTVAVANNVAKTIKISWSGARGNVNIDRWDLDCGQAGGCFAYLGAFDAQLGASIDSDVVVGQRYRYKAYNSAGTTTYTDAVALAQVVAQPTPPPAPTPTPLPPASSGLALTSVAQIGRNPEVAIQGTGGASNGFGVVRWDTSCGNTSDCFVFVGWDSNGIEVIDSDVRVGRPYRYQLTSDNGSTAYSSPITVESIGTSVCGGRQVFRDDFDGSAVDADNWRAGLYWGYTNPANGELQTYSSNLRDGRHYIVSNGSLRLQATKAGDVYTSGALTSDTAQPTFDKGCYEVRAKMPMLGSGTWPAFWLATQYGGVNEAQRPEIDVIEHIGEHPKLARFAAHNLSADGDWRQAEGTAPLSSPESFHTYSARWSANGIDWYVDGVRKYSTTDTTKVKFYLHLNLAIGGWGGEQLDSRLFADGNRPAFEIDYVLVTK